MQLSPSPHPLPAELPVMVFLGCDVCCWPFIHRKGLSFHSVGDSTLYEA